MTPTQDEQRPSPADQRLTLKRKVAFAAITTLLALGLVNLLVEVAEDQGLLKTHSRDDAVQFVEDDLFEQDGDSFKTTDYGNDSLVQTRFAADKGRGFRMFVLGGSFAMGSPYAEVDGVEVTTLAEPNEQGGMPSWLQLHLAKRAPTSAVEVINAAAGGQNSGRVMDVAFEALQLDPDVLLVATGNNEGALAPSRMREQLHRLGGFRLLQKLIRPTNPEDRSWFTAQDPDTAAVRDQFRNNLLAIVKAAAKQSVPVLLATLPVNLQYIGYEPGHVLRGRHWPQVEGPCYEGIAHFDLGEYEPALEALLACRYLPESNHPPPLESLITMARMNLGIWNEEVLRELESVKGPCIADGIQRYYREDYSGAITQLKECNDVAESLLWLGLSHLELGKKKEAHQMLQQHVEFLPRNRCRPSFNKIIREIAEGHDGVTLVDLQAKAKQLSPDGIPGEDLFLDYCHMRWQGYAKMAEEVLRVLDTKGLAPKGR
ncbi:MAG TPA: hypothetical protein DIU15_12060 [Deltaproteobacteria bacterium]|nr:hypothetical protein [Deltaproteobacteria bacterium]HCP46772.1 hypothetical protein [Deltaproteobacteria bacterium]